MKFPYHDEEYYIDGQLASQLNSIAYNLKKDWDFIILISGDRTVRVGKSVLGMTVCAYLDSIMSRMHYKDEHGNPVKNAYTLDDIYFDNTEMMKTITKNPMYKINHYDEGREGLASSKHMKAFQQDLLDFFAECGQLNNIFVIVLPDFFELKEEIAVGRSEFLLNVYRRDVTATRDMFKNGEKIPVTILQRGQFQFFSRKKKASLYDTAKSRRRKSYRLIKPNFIGRFTNQYPLNEEDYKARKREALARFTEKKTKVQDGLTKNIRRVIERLEQYDKKTLKAVSIESGMNPTYASDWASRKKREIDENPESPIATQARSYSISL